MTVRDLHAADRAFLSRIRLMPLTELARAYTVCRLGWRRAALGRELRRRNSSKRA